MTANEKPERKRGWQGLGYRPGKLGRATLYGTAGLGMRAVLQALYLLCISRWLGAQGYGLFAGSVALLSLCAPVASWGSLFLLPRYISQDRAKARAIWATALVQTGAVGGLLVLAMVAVSTLLAQRLPLGPMLMLSISELILLPVTWAASSQCYALEQGRAAALATCLGPAGRVLLLLGAMLFGVAATPGNAAAAHFLGTAAAAFAGLVLVARVNGWPAWSARIPVRKAMKEGSPFAASSIAGIGYQEVDKVLMLQRLGPAAVGPYTVAFRVASIFLMPVTALVSASLARLMAREGTTDGARTFRAVLLTGLAYGVVMGLAMLLAAPWVPPVFGSDYAWAAKYLAFFAPWPALYSLRQSLATRLTTMHKQALRSTIEFLALAIVIVLNLSLLPRMGPDGAVIALLTAEFLTVVVMGLVVRRSYRIGRSEKQTP